MYPYWFIICNKCTTLAQDVNNRKNWVESEEVYKNSLQLSAHFFCKPKTAQK